jgi:hypothetical protein
MDFTKQISCKSQYSNNGLDKLTRLNKQMKIGEYITTTGMIITF